MFKKILGETDPGREQKKREVQELKEREEAKRRQDYERMETERIEREKKEQEKTWIGHIENGINAKLISNFDSATFDRFLKLCTHRYLLIMDASITSTGAHVFPHVIRFGDRGWKLIHYYPMGSQEIVIMENPNFNPSQVN
jgi:hypothetical protein